MEDEEKLIKLTKEDLGRQAIHSLRGYIYQIYQSLAAWLDLTKDEILLLEVTEDYAVLGGHIINRTQVKDTEESGNVTLRSDEVISLIKSHWSAQNENQDKVIISTLLSTSAIGQERSLTFPDGKRGLEYWRVAAREGADVEIGRAHV